MLYTHITVATNSASVTDNTTIFCIILLQATSAPSKYTAHPLTLRLVSTHFAKSESDLPLILNLKVLSNPFYLQSGFSFHPRSFVLSKNSIIRCTAFTCASSRALPCLETSRTALYTFGLNHLAICNSLPTPLR